MPTQDDHAHALHRLLPDGPVWDGEELFDWLRAFGGEPSRVDAAAERHLANFLPDTADVYGEYILDWARVLGLPEAFESDAWDGYTDAQKAAVIKSKLRGRGDPTLSEMQEWVRILFADDMITVAHKLHPAFLCGQAGCGSEIGETWTAVFSVYYMANVLNASPDDFASWDSVGSVTNNAARSPATELVTADQVTPVSIGGGLYAISTALTGTANDDECRGVVWVRAADSVAHHAAVAGAFVPRSGSGFTAGASTIASQHRWDKLVWRDNVGSGGSDPEMIVITNSPGDLMLSYAMAGIRQTALEMRANQLGQLHTTGEYLITGEDAA